MNSCSTRKRATTTGTWSARSSTTFIASSNDSTRELNEIVDDVAERARSLGSPALGTLREFVDQSRLAEQPGAYPDAMSMISGLLEDHESVIRTLRVDLESFADQYHDMGTNNFLTDLMEKHEKMPGC